MEKVVRVMFRVTSRGGVAVTMKARRPRRVTVGATSGSKYWEAELVKSRLRAIRKAVRGIELVENCNQSVVGTAESAESDNESWHSCVADSDED